MRIFLVPEVVLASFVLAACSSQTPQQRAEENCKDNIMAAIVAGDFVKDQLRSPATAKFPSANSATVSKTGKCSFRVLSYVDAQNGFGALVRANYFVDIEYLPSTMEWKATNIVIK